MDEFREWASRFDRHKVHVWGGADATYVRAAGKKTTYTGTDHARRAIAAAKKYVEAQETATPVVKDTGI